MEERMKKYRQVSPERAVVWTERSPKYQQNRKVPVVYYLSKNRQLEHPHFIEVPVSSPDGLYLRDVIDKLNVLRGRGMASLYSWSCKRSYKSGYVWHDLSEDDLILPAHGSEYVLKGSELFEDSDSGHLAPVKNTRSPIPKQLLEPVSSSRQDDSPSSTSMSGRDTMHSPESRDEKNSSSDDSLSLTDYKVYKIDNLADASTQTESTANTENEAKKPCTVGISTDEGSLESDSNITHENSVLVPQKNTDLCKDSVSPLSSSSPLSAGKTESLEALIRADVKKINSLRVVEEGESFNSYSMKLKPSNMLLQLISCGSISVKDHSFGLVPNYKPSFAQSKFPSPLFSTSIMLGELENPRLASMRLENKEYFSGSLVETNILKGVGVTALKRSSSFNADREGKQLELDENKEETTSSSSKCIPLPIKASLSKQPRNESMRSPVSEGPRLSMRSSPCTSNGGSKRISETSSEKKQSKRLDSFREENDNVIKIEESLLQALGL